jgi:hypothetical protein
MAILIAYNSLADHFSLIGSVPDYRLLTVASSQNTAVFASRRTFDMAAANCFFGRRTRLLIVLKWLCLLPFGKINNEDLGCAKFEKSRVATVASIILMTACTTGNLYAIRLLFR